MPVRPQHSQNTSTTILLFLGLTIAFFPGLFISLLKLPISALSSAIHQSSSAQGPSSTPIPQTPLLSSASMSWSQKTLTLPTSSRGSYLVTEHIVSQLPEIKSYKIGLVNLFIQHTSCALSLNENWDEDVRADMSDALDRIVPEDKGGWRNGKGLYRHDAEGEDDMPAHVKSALIGASVTVPIRDGKLATGTWQGIWYLEFRAAKHSRKVLATIQGEKY